MKLLFDSHTFVWWIDPFDRMLVAQAVTESAAIVSKDPYVARYGVSTIW